MKNIIYIQGSLTRQMEKYLPFKIEKPVKRLLSRYGDNVIIPKVLWHTKPGIYDRISKIIENDDISAIVANSAGGYMGFYLSNKYNIPALLFNPCIVEGKGRFNNEAPMIQDIPNNVKDLPVSDNMVIIIGANDRKKRGGVEPSILVEMLNEKRYSETKSIVNLIDGVAHGIPYWLFSGEFKKFHNKFLK